MEHETAPAAPGEQLARDLLAAALQATRTGDDARASELLERSIAAWPTNPTAHYLLGADCAQRERYGDAVIHLTTAVEQAPELWTARLQLGLLWLTLANPASAIAQLQPLRALPETDALRHFGEAVMALAANDLPGAGTHLSVGLRLGTDNAALRADMQRMLAAIEAQATESESATAGLLEGRHVASVSHGLAISAYTARSSDH